MTIEYDGTHYYGWQRQSGLDTIQAQIEDNLKIITGENIAVHGSGRTDARVHALGQVAHFDTRARMAAEKFTFALNAGLPHDIRIRHSEEVNADFHARFSAKTKHYRYTIHHAPIASALFRNFQLHMHGELDVPRMHEAAQLLLGTHDFAGLSCKSPITNTVRTLVRSEVTRDGDRVYYDVAGNGFLYNMVRIIAGTLIEIGQHRRDVDSVAALLEIRQTRVSAGPTAPPHALTLMSVIYE